MNNSLYKKFHPTALSLAVMMTMMAGVLSAPAMAAETSTAHDITPAEFAAQVVDLGSETVKLQRIRSTPQQTTMTADDITKEIVMNNRDLVRNETDATISEAGRFGSKGFSVQGVDGNRVAMVVDGLKVPEIEVNEYYVAYGYVNDSRFLNDVETVKSVQILKGANSMDVGSGAVGGAVVYRTREPDDLIQPGEKTGGYLKTGYTSKNQEYMAATGLAAAGERWSGMVNYVYRDGHELQNHANRKHDKARLDPFFEFPKEEQGSAGIYPDPSHYKQESVNAKLYYAPSATHRFGVNGSFQNLLNHNRPVTKTLYSGQNRHAFDETERASYGLNYRYTPENHALIDELNVDAARQRVKTVGDTRIFSSWTKEFDRQELRPNYFDADLLNLRATSVPLASDAHPKLGEHILTATANVTKGEYDPYAYYISPGLSFEDNSSLQLRTNTESKSISLQDSIYLNDKISLKAGVRYDDYEIVGNMRDSQREHFEKIKKNFSDEDLAEGNVSPMLKAYLDDELEKPQHKSATTWQAGVQYRATDNLQLDYQVGTGFLMPTANQAYAGFAMFGVAQTPNPALKPEKSLSQQLSVKHSTDRSNVTLAGFYNRYKDFIDVEQSPSCYSYYTCYQYMNVNDADSRGVSLSGDYTINDNWAVKGQVAYQKGKMSNGASLLAIQPLNGQLGVTYTGDDEKYQVTGLARFMGQKKAKDTRRYDERSDSVKPLPLRTGAEGSEQTVEDITKDAWVFDVYGNAKIAKNLSLQAGVYNVFDKNYTPWENIRPLATVGINSMVRGDGIQRFSAPGRNFAVSLNYDF